MAHLRARGFRRCVDRERSLCRTSPAIVRPPPAVLVRRDTGLTDRLSEQLSVLASLESQNSRMRRPVASLSRNSSPGSPLILRIVRVLDTAQTLAVDSNVAKHVRSKRTIRVITLRFDHRMNAWKLQSQNLICADQHPAVERSIRIVLSLSAHSIVVATAPDNLNLRRSTKFWAVQSSCPASRSPGSRNSETVCMLRASWRPCRSNKLTTLRSCVDCVLLLLARAVCETRVLRHLQVNKSRRYGEHPKANKSRD